MTEFMDADKTIWSRSQISFYRHWASLYFTRLLGRVGYSLGGAASANNCLPDLSTIRFAEKLLVVAVNLELIIPDPEVFGKYGLE